MLVESTKATAEGLRIKALQALNVLDTPREGAFDRLVFVAAQAFRAPMAAVALMDVDRQWFKAKVGLPSAEAPRADSFCNVVIQGAAAVFIDDLASDNRFRDHPSVTGGDRLRFYAGVPLTGPDGACVGSLYVLDRVPHHTTTAQVAVLTLLAHEATALLMARVVDDGTSPNWLGYSAIR